MLWLVRIENILEAKYFECGNWKTARWGRMGSSGQIGKAVQGTETKERMRFLPEGADKVFSPKIV